MQYIDERVIDLRHILPVCAVLNIPYQFSDMSCLSDGGRSLGWHVAEVPRVACLPCACHINVISSIVRQRHPTCLHIRVTNQKELSNVGRDDLAGQ